MRNLGGMRKAEARKGDDCTLTRFVKTEGRHVGSNRDFTAPAHATGTLYPGQLVAPEPGKIFTSGHNNIKIGRDVRIGALRGYWIYLLSLEERRTCPRSCLHWRTCYGNSSIWNRRVAHGAALEALIPDEIERLLSVRGRVGILMRLHQLGDFYSLAYVWLWREMLAIHSRLAVYGYTAHLPGSQIGEAVAAMNDAFPGRSMIRFSNAPIERMAALSIRTAADRPRTAFVCPEQSNRKNAKGQDVICATCAACWSTEKNVAFVDHQPATKSKSVPNAN